MTDNNNTPQYSKPINDIQSQEEISEKPYYDNGSAPVVQNLIDNNQPQYQNAYYNPKNNQTPFYTPPPYEDAQQINQAYPGQAPYYAPPINYNDHNNYTDGINNTYIPQRVRPKRSNSTVKNI